MYFRKAIEDMAACCLRCVAIACKTCKMEDIPTIDEQAKWALPEDDLILLAIVGLKVHWLAAVLIISSCSEESL